MKATKQVKTKKATSLALPQSRQVGRLLQFMRQMDVAMTSEGAIEEVKAAFLREDYALEQLGSAPRKG